MIWSVIGITALAGMGGTGLGGLISCLFRKDSSKTVSLLLSFAAGVMTSVVCFDLLTEALHPDDLSNDVGLVVTGVLVGYVVIALLNALIDHKTNHEVAHIDENHPKTADSLEELTHANHLKEHREGRQPRSGLFLAGLVMAAAIALHNVPEGMVIGAAFAAGEADSGWLLAAVIGMHNIPEGMAVSVPMTAGGERRWKAAALAALTGAPTVLGAALGFAVGGMSPAALAVVLSLASGAMLYVVFAELLPEAVGLWQSKLPALAVVLGMIVGMVITLGQG